MMFGYDLRDDTVVLGLGAPICAHCRCIETADHFLVGIAGQYFHICQKHAAEMRRDPLVTVRPFGRIFVVNAPGGDA